MWRKRQPSVVDIPGLLADFKQFLEVDLQRSRLTVKNHLEQIRRFLKCCDVPLEELTVADVRSYFSKFVDGNSNTYSNVLKSLKVFCRDFLQRPNLVATFKFPYREPQPKNIPSKQDLQTFYSALEDLRAKSYFLLYATSALRKKEGRSLLREDVDFENRMINHRVKSSRTKRRRLTFFNSEAEAVLKEYLRTRKDCRPTLLPVSEENFRDIWKKGFEKTGIRITPQVLRDWFCEETGRLGVSDRYIDAFCGRVPKSVLARHYTDYAPEKLKAIYDRADLKVLA